MARGSPRPTSRRWPGSSGSDRAGPGPTALLTAGTHGDEYEGQVALLRRARELAPDEVRGRLVILPALNYPAAAADRRLSPVDGRDLNRCYPGDQDGTVTQVIAHYVEHVLFPMCDAVLDHHSAGYSMRSRPFMVVHDAPDRTVTERSLALADAYLTDAVAIWRGAPLRQAAPARCPSLPPVAPAARRSGAARDRGARRRRLRGRSGVRRQHQLGSCSSMARWRARAPGRVASCGCRLRGTGRPTARREWWLGLAAPTSGASRGGTAGATYRVLGRAGRAGRVGRPRPALAQVPCPGGEGG
jgi:hypothetical protein